MSEQIHAIFHEYTDLVESVSLDEAYLDVTRNTRNEPSATRLAREIKARILAATGLTASAGVAANMFVAKIASDARKPDGLCVVRPEQVHGLHPPLAGDQDPGHRPRHRRRAGEAGHPHRRRPGEDAAAVPGNGVRQVRPLSLRHRPRHRRAPGDPLARAASPTGAEETFPRDIPDKGPLLEFLRECAERVFTELKEEGKLARTVTLKIKYADFQQVTRRRTFEDFLPSPEDVFRVARELLECTEAGRRPVRLAGISLSNFEPARQKKEMALAPLFKNSDE